MNLYPPFLSGNRPDKPKRPGSHLAARTQMFFLGLFVLFSVLLLRLAQLQMVEGPDLAAQENEKTNKDVIIAPIRGNIFDATGAPLASSLSAQSLFYQYEPLRRPDYFIETARKLESFFKELGEKDRPDAAEILKRMDVGYDMEGTKLKREPSYVYQPRRILFQLSQKEIAYLAEHRDEFTGFEIVEESTRYYHSYDDRYVAPQLVGYVRQFKVLNNQTAAYLDPYKKQREDYLDEEYVGFDGLEFMYQNELRGVKGGKTYPVNNVSQITGRPVLVPPEKGHNLHLTIHKDIQLEAQQAIADHLAYMKTPEAMRDPYNSSNAVSGYAVAMEVDTGRVVAMANWPNYDPNIWTGPVSQELFNSVQNYVLNGTIRDRQPHPDDTKGSSHPRQHPSSMVPPGSTIKPLTVLVGLAEGLLSPTSRYWDTGSFEYGKDGSKISNSQNTVWGELSPARAITVSSNTFMAERIGHALYLRGEKNKEKPLDLWDRYMKQFGLGVLTGSGLPAENPGRIEYYDKTMGSDMAALVFSSFGQSAKYTTLQLAQYAAMLGNKGKRMKPLFVDHITSYEGVPLSSVEPELLNEVKLPDAYWKVLEQGMKDVGVMGIFDQSPYTVARKTGTSESNKALGIENAVFISYAPIEKPKLAVAVVVPYGGYGSRGAAPVAKRIYDIYHEKIGLY